MLFLLREINYLGTNENVYMFTKHCVCEHFEINTNLALKNTIKKKSSKCLCFAKQLNRNQNTGT